MQILNGLLEESHLKTIIQFNPFDAVFVIGVDAKQQYYIEMMNSKASLLFDQNFSRPILAEDFFHKQDWNKMKSCIEHVDAGTNYITLSNKKEIATQVLPYIYKGITYYCVIMRYTFNENFLSQQSQDEKKHLHFVEHYVDPVISVDLNGDIVYMNIAAAKNILIDGQIIGENIRTYIEDASMDFLNKLLQSTYQGFTTGNIRIALKNRLFDEEFVSIMSIPTYWEGEIIGAHLIIKDNEAMKSQHTNLFPRYEDELTGLLNRRALNERWNYYVSNFPQLNLALLLVDIDRFKRFNDSLGKQKADDMLAEIGMRFYHIRNEYCEIFRYNGDEYVFLLKYNRLEEIENVANKILSVLKAPLVVEEQEYFVTASIGISTVGSKAEAVLENMLQQADQALFHVKINGRAHYRFYQKEMSLSFPNEALMEAHLKRAIEFDELFVCFQPQYNLMTNTIDSFEALMRWNNRKFGHVPPAQFIPLAESSGLIIQIGDWILERVFQYLAEWKANGYRAVRIAVNISPKQLKQEGFVDRVKELIEKYNVEPKYIELEITEGSMLNVAETAVIIEGLKELGVYVSVDDFGTGYSSLSYLTTYPIDIIKIDQMFIAEMSKGKKNEALVKAIINLSKNLGLEVIAEGVENPEQEKFLLENKCHKVQGFLYDKPLPAEQIVKQYLA